MKLNIPPLSQNSEKWKHEKLNSSTVKTLGSHGCAVTCVAMVCNYFGHETDPARLNSDLVRNNGFYQNMLVWGGVTDTYPDVTVDWQNGYIVCAGYPAPVEKIRGFLDQGYPVILQVDYSPKEGLQEHWVLAVGYNEASATKDLIINDPWDGEEQFFIGRIGPEAEKIYKIVVFKGTVPEGEENVALEMEALQIKIKNLNEKVAELCLENNSLRTKLQKQTEDNQDLIEQLLEARDKMATALREKKELAGANQNLAKQVEVLGKDLTTAQGEIKRLREALTTSVGAKIKAMSWWEILGIKFFKKGG